MKAPAGNVDVHVHLRTVIGILAAGVVYYLATRMAWVLTFPDSKVSLFFPPHAILVSILLLVPTRHWWAYVLVAVVSHFIATQQANWPPLYALQCEVFDALKILLTAAGIRLFIKSPLHLISLREAILFVVIAVLIIPFGTAFWGATFTIAWGFGTRYWVEWRNLGVSNAVTTIVLVPVILIGVGISKKVSRPHHCAYWKPVCWSRALWRSDGSPSIARPRGRKLRPRCFMRPFRCSSGRHCVSGWVEFAPPCC